MLIKRNFLLFALAMLLSGCATQQSKLSSIQELERWRATGKLGIRNFDSAKSVNFSWENTSEFEFKIRLYGALGLGTAELKQSNGYIELSNKDGVRQAPTAEELLMSELGWQIPVSGLKHWIKGSAAPSTIEAQERYPDGNLKTLQQEGWEIRFKKYQQMGNLQLPQKIIASRDSLKLTLVVKTWKF